MEGKRFYVRTAVLAGFVAVLVIVFAVLLYQDQIVNGLDTESAVELNTVTTRETVTAARGIITDRYGRVLVGNEIQYQVLLDLGEMGKTEDQIQTILHLMDLCESQGIAWTDDELPVTQETPYEFTSETLYAYVNDEGKLTSTRLGRLCDAMKWDRAETAAGLVEEMKATFGLDKLNLPESRKRAVLGVLYSCYLRDKELLWTTYAFAENVNIEFITMVKEENIPGVSIEAVSTRSYQTPYAAHLLGSVGPITAENWSAGENYKEQGYDMDDIVGLSGVEYAFESYLQGTDGERTIVTDNKGTVISQTDTVPAKAGDTVALTIDIKLQEITENALATYAPQINNGEGGAAAAVVDVTDGSVLALASWPSFDLETMEYDAALESLSPLYNRALQGTYMPGSTYKMVTAVAGLETGMITPSTLIEDTGVYQYYDTPFRCWLYRQSRQTHGYENVTDAIRDSCNVFFYTLAAQMGIDTLTEYAQAFGLGLPTGIELTESTGYNAGPETSQRLGTTWYGGNTLSAAIGQSDNLFSPLQIANYVATLVNGGNRHSAHLLYSAESVDGAREEYQPSVLNTVAIGDSNLAAVKQGMRQVVTESSTVRSAFAALEEMGIRAGAKTGSAQVSGQVNANGLFVAFAPYDDPEIAICVVVEKGGSGAATATIAAAIMEYYFSDQAAADRAAGPNVAIGDMVQPVIPTGDTPADEPTDPQDGEDAAEPEDNGDTGDTGDTGAAPEDDPTPADPAADPAGGAPGD